MINSLTEDSVALSRSVDPELVVRKARMSDIPLVLGLINGYAAEGTMLPRTEFEISENLRDFTVVFSRDKLAGCGALHFYSPTAGEIRSLAVAKDSERHGVGRKLVESLEDEARTFGIDSVFVFTYVTNFFGKLGYVEVERGLLPLKVWKDCLHCPKFQCCDETAVLKVLNPSPSRHAAAPICGDIEHLYPHGNSLILLPSIKRSAPVV
jgi:amino-acid N-acetyltransferase